MEVLMAALTYIVMDVVETFSDEVAFIWPSRLSPMKVIFFANRYTPFVDVTVGVIMHLAASTSEMCSRLWPVLVVFYALGSSLSETILMVRTMALWNFNKVVIAIMVLNCLLILVPFCIVAQRYMREINYPPQYVLEITKCVVSISDGPLWVFYAGVVFSETTIVGLTLLQQYRSRMRGADLPLVVRTMYRDGTVFYTVLLFVSVFNLVCMMVAPIEMSSALQLPLRALHSTLCSRVLLNLRAAAARASGGGVENWTFKSTGLAFDSPSTSASDSTLSDEYTDEYQLTTLPTMHEHAV
ncbi:hypothetical protein FKP32DRAFT_1758087 [Trametes sanguinea]|nr:hypothetical protein FKP32DRAFT_1758087 [Trametes sanguinea]